MLLNTENMHNKFKNHIPSLSSTLLAKGKEEISSTLLTKREEEISSTLLTKGEEEI